MFKAMYFYNGHFYAMRGFDDEKSACKFAARRCAIVGNVFVVDKQGRVVTWFCGRDAVITGI